MVTLAILAAVMFGGAALIVGALYITHRLTGGKMTFRRWYKNNFEL